MGANDKPGQQLEACPKANQVPSPLMAEYQAMINDRRVKISPNNLLPPEADKSGNDHYRLEVGDRSMLVDVIKGHDVKDQNAVRYLEVWPDGQHRTVDEYDNGVRTRLQFGYEDPKTGHTVIAETTRFAFEAGKQYVSSEEGKIWNLNDLENADVGRYSVTFDSSGKRTDYTMRPFRTFDTVIKQCAE
jgi:hypothetical protein